MDEKLTPTQVAEAISRLPYVIKARWEPVSRRVLIDYPRERGGRIYLSLISARRHLESAAPR